jgi:hypothetical protein
MLGVERQRHANSGPNVSYQYRMYHINSYNIIWLLNFQEQTIGIAWDDCRGTR